MLNATLIHPLTANFAVNVYGEKFEIQAPRPARRRKSVFARMVRPVAVWFRRQAMTARLEALDDRLLADIGIARADISAVVARSHPWTAQAKPVPAKGIAPAAVARPQAANDRAAAVRAA